MKNPRAVLDPRVIEEWAAQLAARRKGIARVVLALLILTVTALGLMLVTMQALFVLLFFGLFAALIITTLVDRHSLHCPNCRRVPIGEFHRGPATNVDFCQHCYYWLQNPWQGPRSDRPN